MVASSLVALGACAVVLGLAAWRIALAAPPRTWRVLAVASVFAVPMAWLATLALAERALGVLGPAPPASYAFVLAATLALVALLQLVALRLPERLVWGAAAVVPVVALALQALKPPTTAGGALAALLALSLVAAAVILPRAAALGTADQSRAFVAIVAVLMVALGGIYGAFLGAAAVREGGLGTGVAERALLVEATPDFDGEYVVTIPFPHAASDAPQVAAALATRWREAAHVASGSATILAATDGASALQVQARGPFTLRADLAFHAAGDAPHNLTWYALPEEGVRVDAAPADGNVTVAWRASAAFAGATCETREATVVVTADAAAPVAPAGPLWAAARCAT